MSEARSGDERAPEENLFGSMGIDAQDSTPAPSEDQPGERDFDWSLDRRDVVLHKQPATAVYMNTRGFMVIRQEAFVDDEPDQVVIIDPAHFELFIMALQQAAGLDG